MQRWANHQLNIDAAKKTRRKLARSLAAQKMKLSKRIFHLVLFALVSSLVFLIIESVSEYVWANWISSKPPWPDQTSIVWLIESGVIESIFYMVAIVVGALLSISYFKQLEFSQVIVLALILATISGVLFTIIGLTELPKDPRISIGVVLFCPVFVVVLSSIGVRLLARRAA